MQCHLASSGDIRCWVEQLKHPSTFELSPLHSGETVSCNSVMVSEGSTGAHPTSDPKRKYEDSDTPVALSLKNLTVEMVDRFLPKSKETGLGSRACPEASTWGPDRSQTHSHNSVSAFAAPQALLTIPSYLSLPRLLSVSFPLPSSLPLSSQGKQHLI